MRKTILGVALTTVLAGCAGSQSITVDGVQFHKNENGQLELTEEDLALLRENDDIVVIDRVIPSGGVSLTQEELNLISKDKQLLAETFRTEPPAENGVFTFMVKKGSLLDNLNRLAEKYSTEENKITLNFNVPDFYVAKSTIIRAESVEAIVGELLATYPVVTGIDVSE